MFEFAGPSLDNFGARDKRENDIRWKSLLQVRLNAEGMGGVDKDAGMLRRDNGFDDGRDVINIG